MVLSRNGVQGPPRRCSPHFPPPLTTRAGDGRTCASPRAPLSTADQSARSKVTTHPHPLRQRPSARRGQGQVPGAGSSAGSTRRRPRGTARWRRRRQGRAPPPRPGRSAHRGAGGQERERAPARDRPAQGPSEAPPENESAGAWGRGRSREPRPQTFPPHPSSTPNPALCPPHPSQGLPSSCLPLNLRSVGGSRTRICSCFAMAPEADAIGETAQSGGAPAAEVCWLGTMAATAQPSSTMGPVHGSRTPTPAAGRLLSSPLGQQLGVSQLTQPHTSRPATRTAILSTPRDYFCVPTCAPQLPGATSARPALKFGPTGRGLVRLRAPCLAAARSTVQPSCQGNGCGQGAELSSLGPMRCALQGKQAQSSVTFQLLLRNWRTRYGNASPSSKWECLIKGSSQTRSQQLPACSWRGAGPPPRAWSLCGSAR